MATIRLIGVPMDLGSDRRGVDMGPSALRYAGVQKELQRLRHRVNDGGNIPVPGPEQKAPRHRRARFVEEIGRTCVELAESVRRAIHRGEVPFVVGGDHSIAVGTAVGLARAGVDFGVLWVDAHADLNTPETTPTGNVHGMPLAAALGLSPAELMDARLGCAHSPPLSPDRIALVGVRDVDPGERALIRERGIRVFTMADIDRLGVARVIDEALGHLLSHCDVLYVSLDMDALDPVVAAGVGTPKEGGLTYREGHYIMEAVAQSGRLAAFEVVEINPILDVANRTAKVACGLAASAFGASVI